MTIAHEVSHKHEVTFKKASSRMELPWEVEDANMITIWAGGMMAVDPSIWSVKKNVLTFRDNFEKGTKVTVREFRVVGQRKRKRK